MISDDDSTSSFTKEFLRLVHQLRKAQNLTLEQLADQAKIHRTFIGLLESGQRGPSLHVAQKIAAGLGYDLSELVQKTELIIQGDISETETVQRVQRRRADKGCIRNEKLLQKITGLDAQTLFKAIDSCYRTLDVMDEQLVANGSVPISQLVELANLSSMVGNLLGAGLAEASEGIYKRNKPHAFPDLLPIGPGAVDLEIKMALETNKPKGHLAKAGAYITFRYILGDKEGNFVHGKENRGDTVWIWEVKTGNLSEDDFALSNTVGDSGKTATIKTDTFNAMPLVYYVGEHLPYKRRHPGFN